ncbi:hypothetical protein [Streptomyces sp. NPDC048663]|uniref:hypothetical protein n=1 Tax=Streptomyces sp. NPDC048663 TaxID=3155638 RepID=UPI0034441250
MQSATIPAEIATARTGRLPFVVQAADVTRERADQLAAQPPADHQPWCVPSQCIIMRHDDGEVFAEHTGETHRFVMTDGSECPVSLSVQLGREDDEAPTVHLAESHGNSSFLDADAVLNAITEFEALAAALRTLHAQMTETAR